MINDLTLYFAGWHQAIQHCDFDAFYTNIDELTGDIPKLVEVISHNWVYFLTDIMSINDPDPYKGGWAIGDFVRRLFQYSL
jgi:hypothetical protein